MASLPGSHTRSTQRRRSRLEILLSVLSVVNDGVDKPTHILYSVNLSWIYAQRIMCSLVEQGLLNEVEETGSKRSMRRYEITEKGTYVLRYFDNAKDLFDIYNVNTND